VPKLDIIKSVSIVEGAAPGEPRPEATHTVSLVGGEPAALDGVSPAIVVRVADPERDAGRLLRAAEELLPLHRQAPGVIVVGAGGEVQGVIPRPDLEEAVLRMRSGDYVALAKGLGLRADYRIPAGDIVAPFVYWRCPQCSHVRVPPEGHEDDPPPECRLHDPPVHMERRVHGGE